MADFWATMQEWAPHVGNPVGMGAKGAGELSSLAWDRMGGRDAVRRATSPQVIAGTSVPQTPPRQQSKMEPDISINLDEIDPADLEDIIGEMDDEEVNKDLRLATPSARKKSADKVKKATDLWDARAKLIEAENRKIQEGSEKLAETAIQTQDRIQEIKQRRKQQLAESLAQFEEAQQRVVEAEPDPGKYWADRGVMGRILGALALAIGGATEAMGGPNNALKIIEGGIQRDLEAQKAVYESRQRESSEVRTAYGQARQILDDEEAATMLAHNVMRQSILDRVENSMQMSKNLRAQNNLEITKQQIEENKRKDAIKFAQSRAREQRAAEAHEMSKERHARMQGDIFEGKELAFSTVEDPELFAKSAKDAIKFENTFGPAIETMNRLVELRRKYGGMAQLQAAISRDPESRQEIYEFLKETFSGEYKQAVLDLKEAFNMGAAFTENEEALLRSVMGGDPSRFAPVLKQLLRARERVIRRYRMQRVGYGLGGGGQFGNVSDVEAPDEDAVRVVGAPDIEALK